MASPLRSPQKMDLHLLPPSPSTTSSMHPSPSPCTPKSTTISSGQRLLSFLIRAIVMATAIPLFFLFASLAALLLLHLWLAATALRRHRNISSSFPIQPNPVLDPTPTLSAAQLRRMPCCIWRWPWPKDQCCAVCLDKVQRGELYRSLPACSHVFHKTCVDKWLLRCPKCPLCRQLVTPV